MQAELKAWAALWQCPHEYIWRETYCIVEDPEETSVSFKYGWLNMACRLSPMKQRWLWDLQNPANGVKLQQLWSTSLSSKTVEKVTAFFFFFELSSFIDYATTSADNIFCVCIRSSPLSLLCLELVPFFLETWRTLNRKSNFSVKIHEYSLLSQNSTSGLILFSVVSFQLKSRLILKTDCIRASILAGRTIVYRGRWDANEFWITKHINNTLNRWAPTSTSCGGSGVRKRLVVGED